MGTPDFNFSFLTATEANYAAALLDLFRGLALGLDTTVSNPPTGAIRWSSANSRWEKYNGTTWAALVSKYLIDVDTLDGLHAADLALVGHNHSATYQPLDAELTALARLTSAADKAPYFIGSEAAALMTVTAAARSLLDDTTVAAMRATLGAQTSDATLSALAALTTAANKLIYATGSDTFSTCDFPAQARTLLTATTAALQRTALGLGTAAVANTGTASGNVPVLDTGGKLATGVIPAGIGGEDTTARDNAAMTALLAWLSAGRATGPVPGGGLYTLKTDELTNSGGSYTTPGKYYANSVVAATKYALTAGMLSAVNILAWNARMIDGVLIGAAPNPPVGAAAGAVRLVINLGSAVALHKWRIHNSQAAGENDAGAWKIQYSSNGSAWTDTDGATSPIYTGTWTDLTWGDVGPHPYWSIINTATLALGRYWNEMEVYAGSTTNMTLTSASAALGSIPTKASLYLLHKAVDALTLNTDIKVSVSRGGGWAEATDLTALCQYDADYTLLRASVDLSALPSGSSVSWRAQTFNTKSQRVRGALLWAG